MFLDTESPETDGEQSQTLVVDLAGEAQTAFARNRIGLVVLHPAAAAGTAVTVRHTDGSETPGRWPVAISPHQPCRDVAGFAWSADGLEAGLTLDGDVFETEDQRNWTDASFKTYSTPLDRPVPVAVAVGDGVHQQVRLQVGGRRHSSRVEPTAAVVTVGRDGAGVVPALGLEAALHPTPAGPQPRHGGYATVLVELTGPESGWPATLNAATDQARDLGAELDVRLVTDDPAALSRGLQLLTGRPVRRVAVFDPVSHLSSPALWSALRAGATSLAEDVELVGGTRARFTELNRGTASVPADVGALTFSLTPQMHATEVQHILDSLAVQPTVVANARRIAAGRPLHIGPVTLARRFNAVATGRRPDPAVAAALAVDPLLDTAFAAAWTLASVAALTGPGVASLTFAETSGPRGVLDQDGAPKPVTVVLDRVSELRGRPVLATEGPTDLAAFAVGTAAGTVLLLANLTAARREVAVRTPEDTTTVVLEPWEVVETLLKP